MTTLAPAQPTQSSPVRLLTLENTILAHIRLYTGAPSKKRFQIWEARFSKGRLFLLVASRLNECLLKMDIYQNHTHEAFNLFLQNRRSTRAGCTVTSFHMESKDPTSATVCRGSTQKMEVSEKRPVTRKGSITSVSAEAIHAYT
jgi:hypothetical protein